MKKLLSISLIAMFVFVGCAPVNPVEKKIENVPVETKKVDDKDAAVEKVVPEENKKVAPAETKKIVPEKEPEAKVEEPKTQPEEVKPQAEPVTVAPQTKVVMISDFAFVPSSVTINKGDTIVWKHDDVATHTVVSPGLFETQNLERGGSFSFKFDTAGTYDYYCGIHSSMRGTVVVK